MSWPTLPLELWITHIIPRLNGPDLASLCCTSQNFLTLTRPTLYQRVSFQAERNGQPNSSIYSTLSLLERDSELARRVEELTLDSISESVERYSRNPTLIHPASLKNMANIKRLVILGDLSRSASRTEVQSFVEAVHALNLDELAFPSPRARPFLLPLRIGQLEKLGNPRRLVFAVRYDDSSRLAPVLHRIFAAAQPTLVSICLHVPMHLLEEFFGLRFPRLRSLEVATLGPTLISMPVFSRFLGQHHEQLEELYLSRDDSEENSFYRSVSIDNIPGPAPTHTAFLPNLRVLRANHETIRVLGQARVQSLTQLTKLAVAYDHGLAEISVDFLDCFEGVPLSSLVEIEFDLRRRSRMQRQAMVESIWRVAALAGRTLEVWAGLFPELIVETFMDKAFPSLRRLVLPKDVPGEVIHSTFRACAKLEEIWIFQSTLWTLRRGSGDLVRES
ncbi:BHLH domain-containing protein [Mycena chlorophos]|uniref:BHLH domain-containing protein n=1 Tax=Mycena chlorophos TaxID=658473 RepID=A0A8H6WQR5_MYCCL|nr:BHLH domain-containing protein [Mycena chlorophos]